LRFATVLLATFMLATGLPVQSSELRQPVPGVHALTDVRIVTGPGEVIDNGTVVIRDGVIAAVGADVAIPPDARIHTFEQDEDQDPVTLYPGLIEPYLSVDSEPDEDENGQPPPGRHELLRPDFAVDAGLWPQDRVQALRQAGFTTAVLAPDHGLLRGQGKIVNLGEGGAANNVLIAPFGQFASFADRAGNRRFPGSLMGAVALMRQTLDDARWQHQARRAWQENPAQPRPEWLEGLDALDPVMEGQTPLVFVSEDNHDSLRIAEFVSDESVDLVLVGHGKEYQRLDALAELSLLHILPVDFPEAPEVKDEDDRNVSLSELRHWDRAPDNPRLMNEAGIPFLLTTHELSNPSAIFAGLARAVERGLDPDVALAALTTGPARWLGLDDRAGQIRTGAMANLLVVNGDLFTEGPGIAQVWVDGNRFVVEAIEPPTVDPAGTWEVTLGMGEMGDMDARIVLSGPPTSMTGTMEVMGTEASFDEVRVSGERVIARLDAARLGGSGTITVRLEIDGDRARGTGSGPFGEFTVRGRRTATPDEEEGQ